MGLYILLFGVLLLLTPVVMVLMNNVSEESDVLKMMMDLPYEKLMLFQFLAKSGFMFLGIGGIMYYVNI